MGCVFVKGMQNEKTRRVSNAYVRTLAVMRCHQHPGASPVATVMYFLVCVPSKCAHNQVYIVNCGVPHPHPHPHPPLRVCPQLVTKNRRLEEARASTAVDIATLV
jgi:hypothetical protein